MDEPKEAPGGALLVGLFCVALLGAPIAAVASGLWAKAGQWLVEHNILTQDSVRVTLPGVDGAGFDLLRILLGGGVLLLAVAAGWLLLHHRAARRLAPARSVRRGGSDRDDDERSDEDVSAVLLNLEYAMELARRAQQLLTRRPPPGPAHAAAMRELIAELDRLRRDLMLACDERPGGQRVTRDQPGKWVRL